MHPCFSWHFSTYENTDCDSAAMTKQGEQQILSKNKKRTCCKESKENTTFRVSLQGREENVSFFISVLIWPCVLMT